MNYVKRGLCSLLHHERPKGGKKSKNPTPTNQARKNADKITFDLCTKRNRKGVKNEKIRPLPTRHEKTLIKSLLISRGGTTLLYPTLLSPNFNFDNRKSTVIFSCLRFVVQGYSLLPRKRTEITHPVWVEKQCIRHLTTFNQTSFVGLMCLFQYCPPFFNYTRPHLLTRAFSSSVFSNAAFA
jgi:hypothetical protein